MNEMDIAVVLYVTFMIAATFISFKYGSTMVRKTGPFLSQAVIAGAINLALGVLTITGWIVFSWGVNEFLFFGGLILGISLLVAGEIVLIVTLFLKRKKWTAQ